MSLIDDGYWQVDLVGTRICLDSEAKAALEWAESIGDRDVWVTDIAGSECRITIDRIESITKITPASIANYRRQQTEMDEAAEALYKPAKSWE